MAEIVIMIARKSDREQLLNWFEHYSSKKHVEKRVECYLSHNFTVIAKENAKIVGILQWYIKENLKDGIVEIEEFFVLEKYRGRGIGSRLLEYAIRSIIDHFEKMKGKPRKVFAFVSKESKAARMIFEKNGFKPAAEIDELFADNETVLVYLKNIR